MFMHQVFILVVLMLVSKTIQDDQNVPYLIPMSIGNIRYIKLNNLGFGTFSAPPLAILDIPDLSRYPCFINIRTRRYALHIPVIFWNSTYINDLNTKRLIVDPSGKKIFKVIPPCNILKFQINWRRPDIHENEIYLDSSWYESGLNYILPASQIFIMEFDAGNASEKLCNRMKTDLISTPIQRQEFEIKFKNQGMQEKKIPEVIITSNDLCSVFPLYNECRRNYGYYYYRYNNGEPYILLETAKNVSYSVATDVMKRSRSTMIELQEKIQKMVFDYLCEIQIPYSPSKSRIIGSSPFINTQTQICLIPNDVINNNGTVGVIKSVKIPAPNEEFSIPILNGM